MKKRVLLVHEEAVVRRRLTSALPAAEFEVAQAADGLAALRLIDEKAASGAAFHIVAVHDALPDMDGSTVLAVVKGRFPHTSTVLLVDGADAAGGEGGDIPVPFLAPDRLAAVLRATAVTSPGVPSVAPTALPPPAGAYVLARLDPASDPLKVLGELGCCELAAHCDAVRDDRFGIVQLLRGPRAAVTDQAKALLDGRPGVAGWELVHVGAPKVPDGMWGFLDAHDRAQTTDAGRTRNSERPAAYVIVEANPPDRMDLYVRLRLQDEAVEVDVAEDGRIFLLLQADDFGGLHRVMHERIRMLPGVTRVHEMKLVPYAGG
ncbi:MAG: response regulator transcription factor [Deltaproteobacteria bacterium]|nr:response regulator transcription factor [Deltaproteobacteria bacterium]